jgi:hypothetical protein
MPFSWGSPSGPRPGTASGRTPPDRTCKWRYGAAPKLRERIRRRLKSFNKLGAEFCNFASPDPIPSSQPRGFHLWGLIAGTAISIPESSLFNALRRDFQPTYNLVRTLVLPRALPAVPARFAPEHSSRRDPFHRALASSRPKTTIAQISLSVHCLFHSHITLL